MRPYPLETQNYELIDPMIREWASENSLQLYTENKDVEVRTVLFCDSTGEVRFHISIDPLSEEGSIGVQVYEIKKFIWERRATKPIIFPAAPENLKETLNRALSLVRSKLV